MHLPLFFSTLLIYAQITVAEIVLVVDIHKLDYLHKVDDRFLSFTIDSTALANHWLHLGLRNKKVISLTKALNPSYLRIGGTAGDNLIFDPDSNSTSNIQDQEDESDILFLANVPKNKISALDIIRLGKFTHAADTDLIYGLNVLERKSSKQWDSTNSLKLIKFMNRKEIPVLGWELGNEPNRFRKVFNKTVSGKMLANDFNLLKSLISRFPRYSDSLIIGPDLTHIKKNGHSIKMLQQFLQYVKNDTLSRITFHHYYFNGRNATVKDFLDAEIMDTLKETISLVKEKIQLYQPHMPVWIGETSSGYGGGTPNVSDRFVSSFMWLDKLGQSALAGVQGVFRQTLITPSNPKHPHSPRNSYGLIDSVHHPTPGYFVSYVYKKLVGNKVLNITNGLTFYKDTPGRNEAILINNKIRFYAHCSTSVGTLSDKGIILYGLNVDDTSYKLKVVGQKIEEYLFTAFGGTLTSRYCKLNGKRLKVGKDRILPFLEPRLRKGSFIIPPKTLGFWRLPNLNLPICN